MGKIYDNLREKIPERIKIFCPVCNADMLDDFGKDTRVFSCPKCEGMRLNHIIEQFDPQVFYEGQ